MPFDFHSEIPTPDRPSKELVNAQVAKICAAVLRPTRQTQADLLEFLIQIEQDGHRYEEPFSADKPRPTGKDILNEFCDYRKKILHELINELGAADAARKLASVLRKSLKDFYGVNPDPAVKGPVYIEIPEGKGSAYRPMIKWTAVPSASDTNIPSAVVSARKDELDKLSSHRPDIRHHLHNESAVHRHTEISEFLGRWHFYHLTKRRGKLFWVYQILSFRQGASQGNLIARAFNSPDERIDKRKHENSYEAFMIESHFVVHAKRVVSPSDISINVFPYVGVHKFPLYGATILTTWDDQLGTSASILSDKPLAFALSAKDGVPVSEEIAAQLQAEWDQYSKVGRLPL